MATPIDANYVRARAGLLDVLAALGPLREAAVLVGAQAVYEYTREHTGDSVKSGEPGRTVLRTFRWAIPL